MNAVFQPIDAQNKESVPGIWQPLIDSAYIEDPLIDDVFFVNLRNDSQRQETNERSWKYILNPSVGVPTSFKAKSTARLRNASSCSLIGTEDTYLQSYVK